MAEPEHGPISAERVPELVLEACPSFAPAWESIREENEDSETPGGRLGYLDAGELVRHMVRLKVAGTTDEFPAVFDLIERLVVDGDPYVSELAVIGYLEGFQMRTVTDHGLDPDADFGPWLRPTSRAYWEAIWRFWQDGTPIPYIPPVVGAEPPNERRTI